MKLPLALSRYTAAAVLLVLGFSATAISAVRTDSAAREDRDHWLATRGEVLVSDFDRSLGDALNDLKALAAFLSHRGEVDGEDFDAFVERIDLGGSVIGVAVIPTVAGSQRDEFVDRMREEYPEYTIRDAGRSR